MREEYPPTCPLIARVREWERKGVSERESERERERKKERARERKRSRERNLYKFEILKIRKNLYSRQYLLQCN